MKKALLAIAFLALTTSAFAWPACSGNWVQVPTGTSSVNGVIEITGDHLTFQCQKPTDPKSGAVQSTAVATATGGNATQQQGQTQGQSQSSENTNTNTNSNQSSASASNSGNNSSYSNTTNIAAPKIPVATAYAPSTLPSAPCVKGFGAGIQTMPIGGSFGGSKIDDGCDARETARSFALLGSRLAACKIMVAQKKSKKAGVTLEDCMASEPQPEPMPVAVIPPPAPTPIAITVTVPEPVVLHDTLTVQATPAQVKSAQSIKPVKKHRQGQPCLVPESLKTPMVTK